MSKRIFQHPPEATTGKKYWRSLGQRDNTPEFRGWLDREFPQGASEFNGGEVSRRNFLQLMGASMALAGLSFAGCRRPEKHLMPFTHGVEWSIPGKALYFATSYPTRKGAAPLVVATHDGRPTKIEGNPLHPLSKGKTDMHSQSSILDMYDPDRSKFFLASNKRSDEASFEKALDAILKDAGAGEGIAFLLQANHSPSRERLRAEVSAKLPKATWTIYEAAGDSLVDDTSKAVFGGTVPIGQIDEADVILAIDHDFLGVDGEVGSARAFGARRKVTGTESKMNRLYVVENRYTETGGIADHRLRVQASQAGAFTVALAAEIAAKTNDAALTSVVKEARGSKKFEAGWVEECAADLIANKGKALVLVGPRQPVAVQALGAAINAALGSLGKTLVGRPSVAKPAQSIVELAKQINDNAVTTLFILGGNPAYDAPADLKWADLQLRDNEHRKIKNVIQLSLRTDETTALTDWHIPGAHYLEAWGDGFAADGSYTSVQPMILPLFGGWSELDFLARIATGKKVDGLELVQTTFKGIAKAADFTAAWAKFLRDGFLDGSAAKPGPLTFNAAAAADAVKKISLAEASNEKPEIVFVPCAKVDDGRFSNNGWLQEIPDPISKLTWDNAALISPAMAKRLDLDDGEMIEIVAPNNAKLEIPVLRVPGTADNSITIALGYGRTAVGRVGKKTGFNVYPLRTSDSTGFVIASSIRKTKGEYELAVTQEHGALEGRGPDLTREATLDEYKGNPHFVKHTGMDAHIPENKSLYSNPPLNDIHQWAMTVDLNSCTGCSICMIACQAENNIPIVGKEQVINGREMHWIRSDRYFASLVDTDEEPELISQPMMCQHCENAPCETVCPVNATVHSEDGLNVMAYNRCIGTRYCANNCPFKVRRFNFFDYNQRVVEDHHLYDWNLTSFKGSEDLTKMSKNPNVTVRMRGVMEKCTFCVQRIQEAKIAAKVKGRDSTNIEDIKIPADAFTSACAQACPADAITFGDKSNPNSSVSKLIANERGYRLLEYLNVASRVTYLARIKNPNPKMPGAAKIGEAMGSPSHSKHHGPAKEGAEKGVHH